MTESTIYKIVDNSTGDYTGAYSRSYHTEYEFSSVREARDSNVNGVFYDKRKYRIQKWKVTYELVDDDVDPFIQSGIPLYKDYLHDKEMREIFKADMMKGWKEAFNQFTKNIQ